MKRLGIFVLLFCFTFGIATVAMAQLYFEDNFDNANDSKKKWVPLWGTWEFKNKEYHQLSNDSNCMSVVADDYWDEEWNDYTYEVRGNKIDGVEGFLIMFRCQGPMEPRGKALKEHPPRMQKQQRLEYWWNLGGWGNTTSKVESWGGVASPNTNHTIKTGEWYNIKIVSTPTGYTLYLNDEKVGKTINDATRDGVGRIGVATWSTTARYEDVLVYGPDGPLPVDPKGKVATTWGFLKAGR
ncbi:hypothetical protein C6501_19360 [Candidatus Poribacteria bacterium]|nr:MAG: hypothetical protein C6501_19360 [Candidatus Poribacteria bacterium]